MLYNTWVTTEVQIKSLHQKVSMRNIAIFTCSPNIVSVMVHIMDPWLSVCAPPSDTCLTRTVQPYWHSLQSHSLPVVSSAGCRSGAVPVPRPGAGLWQRPAPRHPSGGHKCHHDVSKIKISAGFNLKRLRGGFHPVTWQGTGVSQLLAFHPSHRWLWPTDWLSLWLNTLMGVFVSQVKVANLSLMVMAVKEGDWKAGLRLWVWSKSNQKAKNIIFKKGESFNSTLRNI